MAVWSYADFESQSTDTERLTRLRLHISEVEAAIVPDMSAHGMSQSNQVLESKLTRLYNRLAQLESAVGDRTGAALGVADFSG
jgi:hypothetical protein